jgi:oxygen-independent coproporphyrinogen-3 oxidase
MDGFGLRDVSITSIYFGGGTPSLVPQWFIDNLLNTVQKHCKLVEDVEITLEANPRTIDSGKARDLRDIGVNRLSIGVQSIIDEDLQMLGRIHSANDAISCVLDMTEVFSNVSIDMIYNRPHQTVASWQEELRTVLQLPVNHVSLYELIIEDGTKLKHLIDSNMLPSISDSSEFFENTITIAEECGFELYEVSNFAKMNDYSQRPDGAIFRTHPGGNPNYGKHNLSYWRYEDYYGIGPGSHSRISFNKKPEKLMSEKIAIAQIEDVQAWREWALTPRFDVETLSKDDEFKERTIMGLRAMCGICPATFDKVTKIKYGLQNKLAKLEENSYIMANADGVVLTYAGILRLNLIVRYLTEEFSI